jgi:hypothetical protein
VNLGTLQHYWGSERELLRDLLEQRKRFRALYGRALLHRACPHGPEGGAR